LAGVWIVNETLRTVTAPNAALKPETSKNFTGRLAYYFEPVGLLAVTATQRNVKNIFITDTLTAQDFGYSGNDELQAYDFITTRNGRDTTRVRSFELEYNQSLGFLGSPFKRLTVRGSYTRAYAAIRTPGITPRLASGGLYYTLNRLQVYANYNWADDWLRNLQTNVYRRHRSNLDLGGSWRLNQTYQLSASVRNVLDQPWIDMQPFANGFTAMTAHQTVGVSWTFAVKGTY
jgi:outer membrane receptor protein involved in Fe transport